MRTNRTSDEHRRSFEDISSNISRNSKPVSFIETNNSKNQAGLQSEEFKQLMQKISDDPIEYNKSGKRIVAKIFELCSSLNYIMASSKDLKNGNLKQSNFGLRDKTLLDQKAFANISKIILEKLNVTDNIKSNPDTELNIAAQYASYAILSKNQTDIDKVDHKEVINLSETIKTADAIVSGVGNENNKPTKSDLETSYRPLIVGNLQMLSDVSRKIIENFVKENVTEELQGQHDNIELKTDALKESTNRLKHSQRSNDISI